MFSTRFREKPSGVGASARVADICSSVRMKRLLKIILQKHTLFSDSIHSKLNFGNLREQSKLLQYGSVVVRFLFGAFVFPFVGNVLHFFRVGLRWPIPRSRERDSDGEERKGDLAFD